MAHPAKIRTIITQLINADPSFASLNDLRGNLQAAKLGRINEHLITLDGKGGELRSDFASCVTSPNAQRSCHDESIHDIGKDDVNEEYEKNNVINKITTVSTADHERVWAQNVTGLSLWIGPRWS